MKIDNQSIKDHSKISHGLLIDFHYQSTNKYRLVKILIDIDIHQLNERGAIYIICVITHVTLRLDLEYTDSYLNLPPLWTV